MKKLRRIILLFMVLTISLLAWLVSKPATQVNQNGTDDEFIGELIEKLNQDSVEQNETIGDSLSNPTAIPIVPTTGPNQILTENTEVLTQLPVEPTFQPTTIPAAPKKSILDFLKIATQPVGKTMYVWGGGWNEEDTAAGIEAVTIGISPAWEAFAVQQNSSYDYNTTRYQIHNGLDCSGFIGWAVYNTLETENGNDGYVLSSSKMAQTFADKGLGTYIPAENITRWQAGDIMSMNGHVWIAVGMCEDGSVLLLHASPPGVIFSGTNLEDGSKSQAVSLAEQIMRTHYPDWYAKYPDCARSYSYLRNSSAMRWSREVLSDNENLSEMNADEVVQSLFYSI